MRIGKVEAFTLYMEYPGRRGFQYAGGQVTGRVSSLVRITTESGEIGWGASYAHPDLAKIIIERHLAPHLLGEDPCDAERLWDKMYGLTRWYGRKGVALSAMGGVDIALWDLRGKALGAPLYRLLGGRRNSVPAYASGLFWHDDPRDLTAETRRHISRGFRRVKMRLGRGSAYDRAAVAAVREGLAEGCQMIVDGSHRYSMENAESLGHVLAGVEAFWFEEPFPPEDLPGYTELRRRIPVPLAMGENDFGYQGFREMILAGAVDIAQPDACRAGGITECRRIGALAGKMNVRIATHTWSDAVALMANAHFVASLPHGLTVEVDQTGNPFIDDLLTEPLQVKDGLLNLPDRPGLGIDVRPDALKRLTLPEGTSIPNGNYSDLVFGPEHYHAPAPYAETR